MAKLVFLGTKGEIEESNEMHQFHASLLIITSRTRLLIDYGKLRRYTLGELRPDGILITHCHPDPYAWLKEDIKTALPVFLTQETYDYGKYHPDNPHIILPGKIMDVGDISWFAYRVIHSIRCPTVGYRLKIGGTTVVYNPDLVDIVDKEKILTGVDYYIGDGSSVRANLVRRRGDQFFGHARMATQINWCKTYGIPHVIFTHLGKETLEKERDFQQQHPEAILAYDDMTIFSEVSSEENRAIRLNAPRTPGMKLRDARPHELEEVSRLLVDAYQQYKKSMSTERWEWYRNDMMDVRSRMGDSDQIVAEIENRIVGTVTLYLDGSNHGWPKGWAGVRLLGVHPDYRGNSIGRALMEECVRRCQMVGIKTIGLHTTELMEVARAMYERMGFKRVPEFDIHPEPNRVVCAYRLDL